METCKELFGGNLTANKLKFGPLKNAVALSSFGNLSLREYMMKNKKFASRNKLYLIIIDNEDSDTNSETESKMSSDGSNGSEDAESDAMEEDLAQISEHDVTEDVVQLDCSAKVRCIPESDIVTGRPIGEGGQARVYSGTWCGLNVAIKRSIVQSRTVADSLESAIKSEAAIHSTLQHPNIVRFFGYSKEGNTIALITERMHSSLYPVIFRPDDEVELTNDNKFLLQKNC